MLTSGQVGRHTEPAGGLQQLLPSRPQGGGGQCFQRPFTDALTEVQGPLPGVSAKLWSGEGPSPAPPFPASGPGRAGCRRRRGPAGLCCSRFSPSTDTGGPGTAVRGRVRGEGVSWVTRASSPPPTHCPGRAEAGEPHRAPKSQEPRTRERSARPPGQLWPSCCPEPCRRTGLLPMTSGPRVHGRAAGPCPQRPHRLQPGSRLSGLPGGVCREVAVLVTQGSW